MGFKFVHPKLGYNNHSLTIFNVALVALSQTQMIQQITTSPFFYNTSIDSSAPVSVASSLFWSNASANTSIEAINRRNQGVISPMQQHTTCANKQQIRSNVRGASSICKLAIGFLRLAVRSLSRAVFNPSRIFKALCVTFQMLSTVEAKTLSDWLIRNTWCV